MKFVNLISTGYNRLMETITLAILFAAAEAKHNLPSGLLSAVCFVESSHNPNAVHKHDGNGDSLGICQVKYKTAKWLGFQGTQKQLMNPSVNIEYAAKYLAKNLKRYHGSLSKALVAYNQGHAGNVTTSKYVEKVYKLFLKDELKLAQER